MIRILTALLLVITASQAPAQLHESENVKLAGWTSLGSYEPKKPSSLDDIPKRVRKKLVRHLKDRLGEEFFASLRFTGGQIVNLDDLYCIEPTAANYQWEVHSYDLHFEFTKPTAGIVSYTAQIKLRKNGSVMEEIDLPSFRTSPNKLHFCSRNEVNLIALKNGFTPSLCEISLGYNKEADSLIWCFTEKTSDNGLCMTFKNIEISMHDCTVIRQFDNWGIR